MKNNITEYERKIIGWAGDRGILDSATRISQFSKTLEETTELLDAIVKDNKDEARDAIGDIIVTLVAQAHFWDLSLEECMDAAWNEIKDRKGKMVNGVFVKE